MNFSKLSFALRVTATVACSLSCIKTELTFLFILACLSAFLASINFIDVIKNEEN
jgi:hypothetical protein